jgi:hypothetical protein
MTEADERHVIVLESNYSIEAINQSFPPKPMTSDTTGINLTISLHALVSPFSLLVL